MKASVRRYPVGIQSFEEIRSKHFLYVDKTELVYDLVNMAKYYFINRPRRFGKSLLLSTLAAYFEGRRDLFEGLAISRLEKEWKEYPVLRFDFSTGRYDTAEILSRDINTKLLEYERLYGMDQADEPTNVRLRLLIREVYRQTGRQVVVLVDEYDSALLYTADRPELQHSVRVMMRNLFAPLKEADPLLRFVLLTGITKFSQMSVFSELNNLLNISMLPQYDALCGITEEELTTQMRPDIERFAALRGQTFEQAHADLKRMYDGYHFSYGPTEVYNPFSLLKCFLTGEMKGYWFASATPTFLIKALRGRGEDLVDVDGVVRQDTAFDIPVEGEVVDPIPLLFQSGYLTVKRADLLDDERFYTLGFPNKEVKQGMARSMLSYLQNEEVKNQSAIGVAYARFVVTDDFPAFVEALKRFFAAYPYNINNNERHYQGVLYTLFASFGADVSAEHVTAMGRVDIVLRMPKTIYVVELKYDRSAEEGMCQVVNRRYAEALAQDGRPVRRVALNFSAEERNISDWEENNGFHEFNE